MASKLQNALIKQASRREPRFRRAFIKATGQMQERVPFEALVAAVATGNVNKVIRLIETFDLETPLGPLVGITEDAFMKGGKLGARAL